MRTVVEHGVTVYIIPATNSTLAMVLAKARAVAAKLPPNTAAVRIENIMPESE